MRAATAMQPPQHAAAPTLLLSGVSRLLSVESAFVSGCQRRAACVILWLSLPTCLPAKSPACLPTYLRIVCRSTNASVLNTFTLDLHGQHVEEALQSLERYARVAPGDGSSEC